MNRIVHNKYQNLFRDGKTPANNVTSHCVEKNDKSTPLALKNSSSRGNFCRTSDRRTPVSSKSYYLI